MSETDAAPEDDVDSTAEPMADAEPPAPPPEPPPPPGGQVASTELVHRGVGSTDLIAGASPADKIRLASEMAKALNSVIVDQGMRTKMGRKKVVKADGREEWVDRYHVNVEGWQTLATLLGIAVVPRDPQPIRDDDGRIKVVDYEVVRERYPKGTKGKDIREGRAEPEAVERARVNGPEGFTASVDVYKDGNIISTGHSRCTRLEEKWRNDPDYALEGMAQTRAIARAVAGAARWIVTLAGYSGTPAEEVPQGERDGNGEDGGRNAFAHGPKLTDEQVPKVSDALVQIVGGVEGGKEKWDAIKARLGYIPQAVGFALVVIAGLETEPETPPEAKAEGTEDAAQGGGEGSTA